MLCCAVLLPQGGKKGGAAGGQAEEPSDIFKIVKMIVDRNFDPVIVFSFSKRECEVLAAQVGKHSRAGGGGGIELSCGALCSSGRGQREGSLGALLLPVTIARQPPSHLASD